MARLTEKDWKKLRSTTYYRGTLQRPTPRWVPSRKGQRLASAWERKLQTKESADERKEDCAENDAI